MSAVVEVPTLVCLPDVADVPSVAVVLTNIQILILPVRNIEYIFIVLDHRNIEYRTRELEKLSDFG